MEKPYQAMLDIEVLPAHFPIPNTGFLPVNAFVIKAREPVLVDTGMGIESEDENNRENNLYQLKELANIAQSYDKNLNVFVMTSVA